MSQTANSQGRDDGAIVGKAVHTARCHSGNTVDDFGRNADSCRFSQEVLTEDIEGNTEAALSRTSNTGQDVDH